MKHRNIGAAAALGAGLLVLAHGGAEARIVCDGNFQIINGGGAVSTPYCREANLAHVARTYGMSVSVEAIRYSESTKAQVCRTIGYDIRVQDTCTPYLPDGGGSRFSR